MKTTSKILVLIISMMCVVLAVLIYAKTLVQPPKKTEMTNQYTKSLDDYGNTLKQCSSNVVEDSIFYSILDRIDFQYKEKRIEANDFDNHIETLINKYTPLFFYRTYNKFRQPQWYEEDHQYILGMIEELKSLKYSNQSQVLGRSTLDSLIQVKQIITDYREAWKVCRQTSFRGIDNARSTISKARTYASKEWLSNCQDLVRSLGEVKTKIEQSHYNYVTSEVNKLSQYRYYSNDYYENTLVTEVDNALTEYDKQAAILYGSKRNVNDLVELAKNYVNDALDYYSY